MSHFSLKKIVIKFLSKLVYSNVKCHSNTNSLGENPFAED